MIRRIVTTLALILFSMLASASGPRKLIFDTDWWTDVDDACAIRILLDADRRGDIELLGICLSAVNATSAKSLDSFLRHEGCTDIPLGADKQATDYNGKPCYHQLIIDSCKDDRARDLVGCEDCVDFYRRLLAESKGKVDIVAVGYPNALARLLESGPDEHSRLSGEQLVRRKAGNLYMMAGNYPSGKENNFCRTERSRKAGATVCSQWPGKITFLGFETGIKVVAGGRLDADDLLHEVLVSHKSGNGRYAWDPMTTLIAITGNPVSEGYVPVRGTNKVNAADGSNTFIPSKRGKHSYVVMDREARWYADRIDALLARPCTIK